MAPDSTDLATLHARDADYALRRARRDDLPALIALLATDAFRGGEDSTSPEARAGYERAFDAIDADPANLLVVVEPVAGPDAEQVVGTMQLTLIPGLARGGSTRLQIEAVRIDERLRSGGIGSAMIRWAVDRGREQGASLVQLTSDARRIDAHRFYARLGFEPSHTGFKLFL
ncbi:GNAT family N-acetyltransferase [Agromyces protaetiae]|uniref:GNAT family N-acetyltransferase n=1 Tax=Agromyces protaetiae TaxID=2509455 RepID=A0A4P6F907_9MICO|nr:GNAT family N-acetyltransferase [Agromyces protaetiae]QAY72055.1 GNAT family N-acetyltransferase [Agromyces protaetiae]